MCTLWSNTNTNRVKYPNTYELIIVVYNPVFNFILSYFFILKMVKEFGICNKIRGSSKMRVDKGAI